MKKLTAILLSLLMLASLTGCGQVETRETEKSSAAVTAKTETEDVKAEDSLTEAAGDALSKLPSLPAEKQEEEPAPETPAETSAAPVEKTEQERFEDFDREFYIGYLSTDLSSLHQLLKDPEAAGVDMSAVEKTLGSYSPESYAEDYDWFREQQEKLNGFSREALTEEQQLTYDTLKTYLEWELEGEEFYGYDEPLTAYTGIQVDIPLIFWMYEIHCKQDAEDYLALLGSLPELFESLIAYEQYRSTLGIFMTESALDKVEEDLKNVIDKGDSLFIIRTFEEALDKLTDVTEEEREAMKAQNRSLVGTELHNGYQDLYDALEALRPGCRESLGIMATGNETYQRYFSWKLKNVCNEDVTLKDVSNRLYNYTIQDYFIAYTAYQKSGYLEDVISVGTVEENMEYLYGLLKDVLPEVEAPEVTYEEVPEEMKDMFSPAAYLIAALDDPSRVTIILNEPEKDEKLLTTLAHEGWYGHLYQYAAVRSSGVSRSRQLLQETAYSEAFSQLGEYLFATHSDRFDESQLLLSVEEGLFECNLSAYCSMIVNGLGYSEEDFVAYLSESFGYGEEIGKNLYSISVDMPFYYLPYAYGIDRIRELKSGIGYEEFGDYYKALFKAGPTYFHLLEAELQRGKAS